ncbi:SoxW family protein [Thiobacillus sedimenti]|uniref:Thioredoxin family protein n=1 Tax=Thiobacillus sedimenti TaxID=3110231 RepID=A0ABZ1CI26_9PROT|nr:thioredoxin family protein [Thiobacillus sp. SCUT-2]WRS39043.1 thioredoxin family protein [Thiobacillus sp. SCUT-2]
MKYAKPSRGQAAIAQLIAAGAVILAWGLALPGVAGAADSLVHARDFQADARAAAKRQVPILVVFTSPGCGYCERVKQDYLIPMQKDPASRKRVLIREVTLGASTPLTGFDGAPTTEGAFAAEHKVYMVPTVQVFDTRGNATGDAIVGLLIPDYYYGYLQSAIDAGANKVRGK